MAQGARPGALAWDNTGALVGLTFTESGIAVAALISSKLVSCQGDEEVTVASSVMYLYVLALTLSILATVLLSYQPTTPAPKRLRSSDDAEGPGQQVGQPNSVTLAIGRAVG